MHLKIVSIFLLATLATVVTGFESLNCREYPVQSLDPFSPTQTVRVCGSGDYEDIPKILRTLLGIKKPAQHLLPPFETPVSVPKYSNGFSPNVVKPYGESGYQNNFGEHEEYPSAGHLRPYPYEIMSRVNSNEDPLIDFKLLDEPIQPEKKQDLSSIVDDVSAVKESLGEMQSYLKDVAQIMLRNKKDEESEKNINVILKLDPNFEGLLKSVFQLSEEKSKEEIDNENEKQLDDFVKALLTAKQEKENSAAIDDDDNDDVNVDNDDVWLSNSMFL